MFALFCCRSLFDKCLSSCRLLHLCFIISVLACLFPVGLSRYRLHSHRHDRQRHRRQYYLPQNISFGLHTSTQESGPWGKWTQSSDCSRTCGGGVAYQTRICLDINRLDGSHSCVGPSKRYYSCNVQDCPEGSRDFRADQCSRFNTLAFEGKYYSWVPFTKGANPCELNCMPSGERFYYRHSRKVIDGTRCYDDGSLDVCVDGICMPVGCDKMLGSNVKEDKCRKCGGDGSSCRTVEGIFDLDNLEVGYNDILVIPAGATNIKITERQATNNYLAVRNLQGEFYLNGNWRIQFPSQLKFAGTTFQYERKPHGVLAPESLQAVGPITESIFIVLLYQERNLGIAYEYSIPVDIQSLSTDATYNWVFDDFGECSRSCGSGIQKRKVTCQRTADRLQVDSSLCNPASKPMDNRTCNSNPCPSGWYTGSWSNCSCHYKVQHRLIYCRHGDDSIVPDANCEELGAGKKPPTVQSCDPVDEPCPEWKASEWEKCDSNCGEGNQTRSVECVLDNVTVDDSLCNPSTRPKDSRICYEVPCEGVEWVISDWTSCDTRCGAQIQTRSVVCADRNGIIYFDEACNKKKMPETQQQCPEAPPCDAIWYTSEWSLCNAKCGDGLQTRQVFCGYKDDAGQVVVVDGNNCTKERPQNVSVCTTAACNGTWFTAPWEECSVPCGGGQTTRRVVCLDSENQVVPDSFCDSSQKPITSEDCNANECDDDMLLAIDDCKSSEFGCCPDGNTTAGNDFEGCPPINLTDDGCNSTKFGCCKDLTTAAFGPFEIGCPVICNFTKFGCCWDGITSANSSDMTNGCPEYKECEHSAFGCCPDGNSIATGKDFEGCPITTTEAILTTQIATEITTIEAVTTVQSIVPNCSSEGSGVEGSGEDCAEIRLGCSLSKFGCCPDGITEAKGKNFKGCGDIEGSGELTEVDSSTPTSVEGAVNCTLTEHGCCPDGVSPATGPRFYGCTCKQFPHGCCQDQYTPARGPDFDGCICSRMLYGCCNDGNTPATGPNYEGCNCESSTYGCCPDMVTIAKGPNFAGCPCESLQFGCCPKSTTPAKGPNFEGCSCASTPFGCCPDGTTVAYGPKFEGCPSGPSLDTRLATEVCGLPKERGLCRNFTVKWYFDINYGGCNRFWYGGCEGNGNRFSSQEQCEAACVIPEGPERCSLPKVTGPCNNSYVAWYFNSETRGCEEFLYGGCLGNTNRFATRDNCEQTCIHHETLDRCEQAPTAGPCRGVHTRWYYSRESGRCRQFVYGGCRGNLNNFESEDECRNACGSQSPHEICALPKAEGPCLGNFPRWYFDYSIGSCKEFVYTGCEGNKNRFVDKTACEKLCNRTRPFVSVPVNVCTLPRAEGPCRNPIIKWYFNAEAKRCERFYYGGCEGNNNKFDDRESCERTCITPDQERNVCVLPKEPGNCYDYRERWFYDVEDRRCHRFYFSGCGGNENNFMTFQECNVRCGGQVPSSTEPSIGQFQTQFCFKQFDSGPCNQNENRWYYDNSDGVCKEFVYGGCGGNENRFLSRRECETKCWNSQDICKLAKVTGPCSGSFVQWYFDGSSNECREFLFSGCQGNANRFTSKDMCEAQCKAQTRVSPAATAVAVAEDVCQLPNDAGSCRGYMPMWYYSASDNYCRQFIYGGCEGNSNRFETRQECESRCRKTYVEEEFNQHDSAEVVCRLLNDPGPCRESHGRWFYDPASHTCLPFVYGGCQGNKNRFKTYEICIRICSGISPRPPPPEVHPPVEVRPPEKADCPPSNCDQQRCPFGVDEFIDERGCSACRCSNPCYVHQCPQDMACAVEAYRTEEGTPKAKAVCRLKIKPGECPRNVQGANSLSSECIDRCRTDADCRDDDKCCNNGCAMVCVYPEGREQKWTTAHTPKVIFPYEPYPGGTDKEPYEEADITSKAGTDVVMDCTEALDRTSDKFAAWSKNGLPIKSSDRITIIANGSLRISALESEDSGTYSCVISTGKTKYTRLTVQAPARILPGPHVVIAQLGLSSLLTCNAVGNPEPTVTWWKGQQMLPLNSMQFRQFTNFTLMIRRVGDKDGGTYTCQAYNGIGSMATWDVQLILDTRMSEPEIRPYEPSYNTSIRDPTEYRVNGHDNLTVVGPPLTHAGEPVTVEIRIASEYRIGSNLQLECVVRGSQADVAWFFNSDIPLAPGNPRYRILPNNTLIVFNISPSDSGEYKCLAANQFHSASASIPINVESTFVPPNCNDSPNFANCDLIVRARYCNNIYYARFCCRSCLLAGQIEKHRIP